MNPRPTVPATPARRPARGVQVARLPQAARPPAYPLDPRAGRPSKHRYLASGEHRAACPLRARCLMPGEERRRCVSQRSRPTGAMRFKLRQPDARRRYCPSRSAPARSPPPLIIGDSSSLATAEPSYLTAPPAITVLGRSAPAPPFQADPRPSLPGGQARVVEVFAALKGDDVGPGIRRSIRERLWIGCAGDLRVGSIEPHSRSWPVFVAYQFVLRRNVVRATTTSRLRRRARMRPLIGSTDADETQRDCVA
jgi:hypothetical protein